MPDWVEAIAAKRGDEREKLLAVSGDLARRPRVLCPSSLEVAILIENAAQAETELGAKSSQLHNPEHNL